MIKSLKIILITAAAFAAVGCSSTRGILIPVPQDGQQAVFIDGLQWIRSDQKNMLGLGTPEKITNRGNTQFVVYFKNNGPQPFTVRSENIEVRQTFKNEWIYRHVFSYDELLASLNRRQQWSSIASSLGSMQTTQDSGYIYTQGSSSGTMSGMVGTQPWIGGYNSTYKSTTYSPDLARAAQQMNEIRAEQQAAALAQRLQAERNAFANAGHLKPQTVLPGKEYGGNITVQSFQIPDEGSEAVFRIQAGPEVHEFHYRIQKQQ